jgi:hypothetical protein
MGPHPPGRPNTGPHSPGHPIHNQVRLSWGHGPGQGRTDIHTSLERWTVISRQHDFWYSQDPLRSVRRLPDPGSFEHRFVGCLLPADCPTSSPDSYLTHIRTTCNKPEVGEVFYYEEIKRELKRIYINGCRYNERLNTKSEGSKLLVVVRFFMTLKTD